MTCDGTDDDTLTAGDDWVWSWTTSDDVSGWTDEVVTITDKDGTELIDATTTGGLEGAVPETSFADGVFAWFVESDDTAGMPSVVTVTARVRINGVDETKYRKTFRVLADRAVRSGS